MSIDVSIQEFLPHRPPMLMVNTLEHLSLEDVITQFTIQPSDVFVENGQFVEAGLIENAAQTCSAIVGQSFFFDTNNQLRTDVKVVGFISGMKKITIHSLPKVHSTITTKAHLLSRFDTEEYSICAMSCKTFEKEILLFEAEINLVIRERQ